MTASAPEPSARQSSRLLAIKHRKPCPSRDQMIGTGAMSSMGQGDVPSIPEQSICNRTAVLTRSADDESVLRHRARPQIEPNRQAR
jgi:hypothetical protein